MAPPSRFSPSMVAVAAAMTGDVVVVSASIAGDETLSWGAQLTIGKEAGSFLQKLHRPVRPWFLTCPARDFSADVACHGGAF